MKRTTDADYMRECLRLAEKGRGGVSPNPLVGAVVVKNGLIIGRGFHRRFGGPHAEVDAIRACRRSPRGATLYVNLEPCAHQGKTPPCTDLILEAGIARVVVGIRDPNPVVSGRGLRRLRRAGVRIRHGILREAAGRLNEAYTRHVTTGLPLVTLKIAQSVDGAVSDSDGGSRWITGEQARADTHLRRSRADCVLVGAGTVLADDPLLTVRNVRGPQPVRIVLDGSLRVHPGAKIFNSTRRRPTVLVTTERAFIRRRKTVKRLAGKGVTFMIFPGGTAGVIPPGELLLALGRRGLTSVLVEGGPETWGAFLNAGCADRLVVYTAPILLGGERRAFAALKPAGIRKPVRLKNIRTGRVGQDTLIEGDIVHTSKMV